MELCTYFQDGGIGQAYHDTEWGTPCHDDRQLFEYLMLECLSCGLSWKLILKKRAVFQACFADFDFRRVARYDAADVERILAYPGMIRSRRKIEAIIHNAQCYLEVIREHASFESYLWAFTQGRTLVYRERLHGGWLTTSPLSDAVAADLRRRGFKYLGSTTVYSFLQSVGLICDHDLTCPRRAQLAKRTPFLVV